MNGIYLFLGNEPLIIQNKIDNIIKTSEANAYNINKYDCEEVNVGEAVQDAMTPPFLCSQKIVLIKNPHFLTATKTDIKHDTNLLIYYLHNPLPSTTLLIDATNLTLDKKKEVVKELLKVANISETKELTAVEAEGWLKRQFTLKGYTIYNDAVKEFFNRNGLNLMRARNEVEKLINFVGHNKYVTVDDVKAVVTREIETEVFALTNAIIEKNKERIILIYQDLLKIGKDAMQLMGLLSRNLCDLLSVGLYIELGYMQDEIAKALNVSTGRAYYLMRDAKAFSNARLKEYVSRLADLDYKIKTGQIEPTSGLELFLFSL